MSNPTILSFVDEIHKGMEAVRGFILEDDRDNEPLDCDFLSWIINQIVVKYAELHAPEGRLTEVVDLGIIGALQKNIIEFSMSDILQRVEIHAFPIQTPKEN